MAEITISKIRSKDSLIIASKLPIIVQSLANICKKENIHVYGTALSKIQALNLMQSYQKSSYSPRTALIDLDLDYPGHLSFLEDLLNLDSGLRILSFSHVPAKEYSRHVLKTGAMGYIQLTSGLEELSLAIRTVLLGEIYSATKEPPEYALPMRQMEIFRLRGEGYYSRQIGKIMHITAKSVETQEKHIKNKLDLLDTKELLRQSRRWVLQMYSLNAESDIVSIKNRL